MGYNEMFFFFFFSDQAGKWLEDWALVRWALVRAQLYDWNTTSTASSRALWCCRP